VTRPMVSDVPAVIQSQNRTSSAPRFVRVGVCALKRMESKISYALEELLCAAGVPHRVECTDSPDGWDLVYSDHAPADGSLWMAASVEAREFFAEPGGVLGAVETVRVAGQWLRLPAWSPSAERRATVIEMPSEPHNALPDLAAATFFFLSRWEEWHSPHRDRFGRFPLAASVFGRGLWGLNECPVEAYAKALRQALVRRSIGEHAVVQLITPSPNSSGGGSEADAAAEHTRPTFTIGLSHDIDSLRRWDARGFARTGREMGRALVRGDLYRAASAARELSSGARSRIAGRDPHDNLPEILQLERKVEASSTCFLLARHRHRRDGAHPGQYQRLLPQRARLLAAAAEIGLHASTTANGSALLMGERDRLIELSGAAVRGVRYHNLRGGYGALPELAAAGFDYDSTLAFAEEPGFPAGLARPFRPYDRERDCPLELIEIPLAIMDTSLLSQRYLGLDRGAGRQRALQTLRAARAWSGAAALLWHNDNLPPNHAQGYASLYSELIEWVRSEGGRVAPLGEIADDWRRARARLQCPRDEP
jgi:hypothetical protein